MLGDHSGKDKLEGGLDLSRGNDGLLVLYRMNLKASCANFLKMSLMELFMIPMA